MSIFTASHRVKKERNKQSYKSTLTISRAALGDTVRYNFTSSSIAAANKHALYVVLNDVSNIDGLNVHAELWDAYKNKSYSDVINCVHNRVGVTVRRTAYRGDVLDSLYMITDLIKVSK